MLRRGARQPIESWGGKNYISELSTRIVLRVPSGVGWSTGPASAGRLLFRRPAKNQNDENEKGTQHNDLPLGDGASRADTRGHPDTRCCGQPMYVMTFAISDNHACAQKSDSGHDTLDNAARVGAAAVLDR